MKIKLYSGEQRRQWIAAKAKETEGEKEKENWQRKVI